MSEKRKRSHDGPVPDHKRQKRTGFQVGPTNLPDGTYRRKTQQIKQKLIDKAKIKKEYAKLKKQGATFGADESIPQPASLAIQEEEGSSSTARQTRDEEEPELPNTAPHPDRQTLMDNEEEETPENTAPRRRQRKPKPIPFQKEHSAAQKRKQEAEERRKAREEAQRERERKIEERERFRKAMAKARTGGKNGQRKLGRESTMLLEKVRRMVGS